MVGKRGASVTCFALLVASLSAILTAIPAFSEDEARSIFEKSCASCHGAKARGDGLMSASFPVKPKDWSDCSQMKGVTDDTLLSIIKKGGAVAGRSPLMPAWEGALNDQQIQGLVSYIRGFCKK
ncbi:MAG: cytochrome c [Deltaproteobacteria bacterium]|nr:cytochrome c [Deltaproteobacteria bacterium]